MCVIFGLSVAAITSRFPELSSPWFSMRRGNGAFLPTRWSLVRRAVRTPAALEEWIGDYWYPLYAWARSCGHSPEDAADGVQGFLEKLCGRGLLAQADPSRGKLRSWLLTAFGNHLSDLRRKQHALKRGGKAPHISIDWTMVENECRQDLIPSSTPEALYTRVWALTLMEEALERVAAHYRATGREKLFETLVPALERPLPDDTYASRAEELGMAPGTLRQASVRLRKRYRQALLDVAGIRLGIYGEQALAEELHLLLGGGT